MVVCFTDNQIWENMIVSIFLRICTLTQTRGQNVLDFDWHSQYLHEYSVSFQNNSGRQCSLKAATLLLSVFVLFIPTPPTYHYYSWTLSCSLVLFTTSSFCSSLCVCRGCFLHRSSFFFPAESPDHLLLVKGASAPLKTKTKVNCATVVEFEATILSCVQCPHNHRNGEKKVSQSQQQIIFQSEWIKLFSYLSKR